MESDENNYKYNNLLVIYNVIQIGFKGRDKGINSIK